MVGSVRADTLEADSTADTLRRGRKRKSVAAETPEPRAKVARLSKAPASAGALVVQMSRTLVAEDEIVSEP